MLTHNLRIFKKILITLRLNLLLLSSTNDDINFLSLTLFLKSEKSYGILLLKILRPNPLNNNTHLYEEFKYVNP